MRSSSLSFPAASFELHPQLRPSRAEKAGSSPCTDSGEPLQFVRDGHNGFVVPPDARAIAARLTHAIDHRKRVAQMGTRGTTDVAHIAWQPIVETLVGRERPARRPSRGRAARRSSATNEKFSVAVLDMQPIEPAVGGGRLRLLGLYHNLGSMLPTTYVGTYDWPGESYRRHRLSDTLEEIDVPLSDAHFAAAAEWKQRAGGRTIIDSAFSHLAHHSSAYMEAARRAANDADIVVFSHPWVFPIVKDILRKRSQLVVYDSQNVEGLLRHTLLADNLFGAQIATHAALIERDLCRCADLILACSQEDRRLFHQLYRRAVREVPRRSQRHLYRERDAGGCGTSCRVEARTRPAAGTVAIFLASLLPAERRGRAIHRHDACIAPARVTFVICGGVGEALAKEDVAPNVRLTMAIPEPQKRRFLEAADIAVNPMFSGSGTNIKMFDFMAVGLPIVTTAVGARGCDGLDRAFVTTSPDEFALTVRDLLADERRTLSMGEAGKQIVRERYSWERISPGLGRLLHRYRAQLGTPRPDVSVIVPPTRVTIFSMR